MNIRNIFTSRKIKILSVIIILFLSAIIFFLNKFGEIGITPLRDYCAGFKVDRKIIHKVLPDANFKIGSFVYQVDEALSDINIKLRMEGFKNSIESGTFPNSEDYWADPYCIGHQYWLE